MQDIFAITVGKKWKVKVIEWPIVRETEKAYFVKTPGGEIWIPRWRFPRHLRYINNDQKLEEFLTNLEKVTKSNGSNLIAVRKAGRGSSEKSHKFSLECNEAYYEYPSGCKRYRTVRKTMTLPVSQVLEIDGKWMAPQWLIRKKLANKEVVLNATWDGLDAVKQQILAAWEEANGLAIKE